MLKRYDIKHHRWNKAGVIVEKEGKKTYITTHREKLYKHNSLGVSNDILVMLKRLGVTTVIHRLGSKRDSYRWFETSVQEHQQNGIGVEVSNEDDYVLHIPIPELKEIWGK